MGFDELRVNHTDLDTMALAMEQTVKDIIASLDSLENDIKGKVASWDGDQKEAYRTSKAAWDWAMQEMHDLLDTAGKTVYQSNADYAGADKRGAHSFEGINR